MSDKDNETLTVTDNGKSVTVSLNQYAIKVDGQNFTLFDVAQECASLQGRADKLHRDSENVSQYMVAIAGKAGSPATFRALAVLVEEREKWGRAPKGTPKETANLYTASPKIWQQYKSKILAAMEAGILPGTEAELTRKLRTPDEKGQTEVKEKVKLDTVNKLNRARQEAKPAEQAEGPKSGIIVGKDGGEHRFSPEQSKEVSPTLDIEIGVMLAEIAQLYDKVDENMQRKAKERLQRLIKDMEAATPEVQEQAKQSA